jgi:N6-L-threonylcarbamoyladenine synthase
MLEVPNGGRGLRQSEMVFQHIRNYEQLFSAIMTDASIRAIGYSAKPCPREDSYMPVFCVGQSFALSAASLLGVPAYALTHQHGHIYSGFFGNDITDGQLIALHVSGGTLDILKVEILQGIVTSIVPIGGTADLTCGQLIDRVGVAAGLKFPSGAEMEKMYVPDGVKLSVHVNGLAANLSGAETQAMRLLADGGDAARVCSGAIDCAAETLEKLVRAATEQTGLKRFLFTGGVMCNGIIRQQLQTACADIGAEAIFAQKQYCGDNACGLALAAQKLYERGVSA